MKADKEQIMLTEANFRKKVLKSNMPVLVEFVADWSGLCHILEPILKKIAVDFQGKIKVRKINVGNNEQLVNRFGIREISTLLFFKLCQVVDHIIKTVPKEVIVAKFNRLLESK